jgi:hypothetical protein
MKRGRKVTKGPIASIAELRPSKPPTLLQRSNKAQIGLSGAVAALRMLKEHSDQKDWIDAIEKMIFEASDLFADITRPLIEAEKR